MPQRQETCVFSPFSISFACQYLYILIDAFFLAVRCPIAAARANCSAVWALVAAYQSEEPLHVIICGECNFAVTQDLLQICKVRLRENRTTYIRIQLEEVITFFNSCPVSIMLLLSDWLYESFHIYVDNCSPLLLPFAPPASS